MEKLLATSLWATLINSVLNTDNVNGSQLIWLISTRRSAGLRLSSLSGSISILSINHSIINDLSRHQAPVVERVNIFIHALKSSFFLEAVSERKYGLNRKGPRFTNRLNVPPPRHCEMPT